MKFCIVKAARYVVGSQLRSLGARSPKVRPLKLVALLTFAVASLTVVPIASTEARELHGRMGLGYNAQFAQMPNSLTGVPALSLKYGLARKIALQLVGGYYSGSSGSGVATAIFEQTLFGEPNLNFFWLLGGGWVSQAAASGTEWISGFGTEFFIPGVESVGISFEAGLSLENLTRGRFILKTFGASFLNAGMHFYF